MSRSVNHLILVRHSLPDIMPAVPAKQWTLSEAGRCRSRLLAEKIASYLPDIVISSIEPKAIETAEIIARQIKKPFHTFEDLHEHDRTGINFSDKGQFETTVDDFFKHPDDLIMGRETASEACQRFSTALALVELENPNKSIVVVSHGTVMSLFVEKITGLEPFPFWKKLGLPAFVVFSLPQHTLVTIVESVL